MIYTKHVRLSCVLLPRKKQQNNKICWYQDQRQMFSQEKNRRSHGQRLYCISASAFSGRPWHRCSRDPLFTTGFCHEVHGHHHLHQVTQEKVERYFTV